MENKYVPDKKVYQLANTMKPVGMAKVMPTAAKLSILLKI